MASVYLYMRHWFMEVLGAGVEKPEAYSERQGCPSFRKYKV